MKTLKCFFLLMAVVSISVGHVWSADDSADQCPSVELNEPVSLGKNACLKITASDYSLRVLDFFNDPCPQGVHCVWSGVGIMFQHRQGELRQKGINLVQAFGYRVTIDETDHETYAVISVNTLD